MIIWVTGLSGVGKTTIAKDLVSRIKQSHAPTVLLDGDIVREIIQDPQTGHDPKSRLNNAYRICRFAKMLESQDINVVISTMSLFHEVHAWNRLNFKEYIEVYIRVKLDILKTRNARGLYERASLGHEKNVVGLDLLVEEPLNPDLILDNNIHRDSFEELTAQILSYLSSREQALSPTLSGVSLV